MQNGVFTLKDGVYNADTIIDNSEKCIKKAMNKNFKIIMTQHENKSFLRKGTDDWDLIEDVKKYSDESFIFEKSRPSIFQNTSLKGFLIENGITTIYVGGLISNGCVKDACLESVQHGFDVYLIDDCHSTVYKNAKKVINDINIQMQEAGINLISTASFVDG